MTVKCECGADLPPIADHTTDTPPKITWTYAIHKDEHGSPVYLRISPPCEKCGKQTEVRL